MRNAPWPDILFWMFFAFTIGLLVALPSPKETPQPTCKTGEIPIKNQDIWYCGRLP